MSDNQEFKQSYESMPSESEFCDPNSLDGNDRFAVKNTGPSISAPLPNSSRLSQTQQNDELLEYKTDDKNGVRIFSRDIDSHGGSEYSVVQSKGSFTTESGTNFKWENKLGEARNPSLSDGLDVGTYNIVENKAGIRTKDGEECFASVEVGIDFEGKRLGKYKASKVIKAAQDGLKKPTQGFKRIQANSEGEVTLSYGFKIGKKKLGGEISSAKNSHGEMETKGKIEGGVFKLQVGCNDKAIEAIKSNTKEAFENSKQDLKDGIENSKSFWETMNDPNYWISKLNIPL